MHAILATVGTDGDEAVTGRVGDAIYILNWLFSGGPEPSAPFPTCGTAMATQPPRSTTPALDCDEPPAACE